MGPLSTELEEKSPATKEGARADSYRVRKGSLDFGIHGNRTNGSLDGTYSPQRTGNMLGHHANSTCQGDVVPSLLISLFGFQNSC